VSLLTDAQTIRDLAAKIVQYEILRPQVVAGNVNLFNNEDANISLTAGQKSALLAQEDGWKATIKTISAAW